MKITELINKFTLEKSAKIAKIFQPLAEVSGLTGFFHYRLTSSGDFSICATNPEWTEEYFEQKYFMHNPFLRHPSLVKPGIQFPNLVRSEQYLEDLAKRKKRIDSDHAIIMIEPQGNDLEAFCFFTNSDNHNIYNFYINELPLLRSFGDYYKREMKDELTAMKHDPANLAIEKKNLFFEEKPMDLILDKTPLLKAMGTYIDVDLTNREFEVGRGLQQGKTYQEIADVLFLSRRTVEKHIEHMKDKLGCQTKSELIHKFNKISSH